MCQLFCKHSTRLHLNTVYIFICCTNFQYLQLQSSPLRECLLYLPFTLSSKLFIDSVCFFYCYHIHCTNLCLTNLCSTNLCSTNLSHLQQQLNPLRKYMCFLPSRIGCRLHPNLMCSFSCTIIRTNTIIQLQHKSNHCKWFMLKLPSKHFTKLHQNSVCVIKSSLTNYHSLPRKLLWLLPISFNKWSLHIMSNRLIS